ncbi:MAG: hypothetical protein ACREV5_15480 [Steroidobacter sp.]
MSAASPAASHVRRTPAAPAPQAARQPMRATFNVPAPNGEDEIRLNLTDIPRIEDSMDVEGFKPSLLSRLFDLVAPLNKR